MLLTEHLKQLRARAKKLGATDVSKQIGCSYATVNNFIEGRNPTEKTMLAVEAAVIELEKKNG